MTREEAIEMLKKDKKQRGSCFISDALKMAIKALEQEPCEDCISRKAVLENAKAYNIDWDTYTPLVVDVEDIEDLPPVTPTQKWISCSENGDENNGKI